jgi:hypothetical protein
MSFRVYVQHGRYERFIYTGVIETNPEQQSNWRDICKHYGYYAFRFIPEGDSHLHVAKRHARKRKRKNIHGYEHTVGATRNGENRDMSQNC